MKRIVIWIFLFIILFSYTYAANNLDTMKVYFLDGDYNAAISEGEKILAATKDSSGSDELYYLLGLSYLKIGNYLRASDIFEILLSEIKPCRFKEEAELALGDTYLLRGNLEKAKTCYLQLLRANPQTKLKPQLYYRLSKIAFDSGNAQEGIDYREKLKSEFPSEVEALTSQDICYIDKNIGSQLFYTVQVGCFANPVNAKNLARELVSKGYPAYTKEVVIAGKDYYRVLVGNTTNRKEIARMAEKLSSQGYPTKICP
ncbi:MAG: SPOR domain-containing protein [Candidatus Omnitrophica bacterium]|nr:SPOR domain-containing protein [Candidatus Omnitrophota bacterium]